MNFCEHLIQILLSQLQKRKDVFVQKGLKFHLHTYMYVFFVIIMLYIQVAS